VSSNPLPDLRGDQSGVPKFCGTCGAALSNSYSETVMSPKAQPPASATEA
jgi:hypothetical protein